MKRMFALFSMAALAACSVSNDQMSAAATGATSAVIAADINDEFEKTQDFDRVAEETVQDFDTTGFDALGE